MTGTFAPGRRRLLVPAGRRATGVRQIDVSYTYDKPTVPAGVRGNACDIGVFGPGSLAAGNEKAFRGWSGGFRTSFSINATEATPGYLAGPVTAGRWHIALGPTPSRRRGCTGR